MNSVMDRCQNPQAKTNSDLELTILMPCLNEAETIGICIAKAQEFLQRAGVKGEVLIADNGSTDGSRAIATNLGARVIPTPARLRRAWVAALKRHAAHTSLWATRMTATISPTWTLFCLGCALVPTGDGQPVPRRHRVKCHAVSAPLSRQPGAQFHRPPVL